MASSVIGNLRVNLGLDTAALQAGMSRASASLAGFGKSMQSAGKTMSLSLTAPLAGFAALSLRAAGGFEASMNRVQAATGASKTEFDAMRKAALDMGKTSQFTASQSADAIEVLAKNGLNASQILGGALNASMLLAASSGTDLASAGDIATDVMLQFGKDAKDLAGLVDGINGVLLESKFGIDDYRLALGQAGGVAGGIGVQFEDFNAVIAGTSSLFAGGSDAGTSYKTFLTRLVPASAPATDMMRKLNLEFFDAQGNMKSMADIAENLKTSLAGLSEEDRSDALTTIFGTDAMRTAVGLMNQGADGINRLKKSIGDTSAQEQADARLQGLNGALLKFRSALEALQIAIADSGLIQFATDAVAKLTQFILKLSESNPQMLKWGVAVAGIAAALGPFLMGLGALLAGIGPIVGGLKLAAAAAALMGAPFTVAAAAIAAAAAAVYANWDSVGPWLKGVVDAMLRTFGGWAEVLAGIFTGDMPRLIAGFKAAWTGLNDFWLGIWDGITGTLEWAWGTIIKPITDKLGATDEILRGWERVKATFDAVLNGVADTFEAAWGRIKPIVDSLTGAWDRLNGSRDGPISSGPYTGGATGPILPGTTSTDMINGVAVGTGAAGAQGAADAASYEQGWRDRMGIHSPSRVMTEIGEYLSQGLGAGIQGGAVFVNAASDRVGGSMQDRFLSYFDGVTQGAKSLKDVFANIKSAFADMLSDMASQVLSSGLSSIFGALFPTDALTAGLRAAGLPAIAANANGTPNWRGGLTSIHERGGEVVNLPDGTQIIPHDISKRMADRAAPSQSLQMQASQLTISDDGKIMATVNARIVQGSQATLASVPGYLENHNKRRS